MAKPEEEIYGSEEEYRDMNGNIVKTGMEVRNQEDEED